MRIGIDVDGVLTNLEEFQYNCGGKLFSFKYGKGIKNYKGYNINEVYDLTEEEEEMFTRTYYSDYIRFYKARKYSSEVITKLRKDGHKIFIITARGCDDSRSRKIMTKEENKNNVKNWLRLNHIPYDAIILSEENKSSICKENRIDIMIDDSPLNLENVSKITKVFAMNANYNMDINNKNITRCYSWYDIYDKIKKGI